jgi:hypothetical protein|tara:strand:- start:16961 stop:18229 length:1269 start_codon:yes stop_codon:yes gene_type:complete
MAKLKPLQNNDKQITNNLLAFSGNGYVRISGSSLQFFAIQRDPNNGRVFSNFYPTFKLPTITHDVNNFQLLGTHLSGLTASTAIMVPIPENKYGQLVDGRTIKLKMPIISGTTYMELDIYSSYYKPENWSSDNSGYGELFGHPQYTSSGPSSPNPALPSTNVAFLYADRIDRPQDDSTLSWATGYPTWTTNSGPAQPPANYLYGNGNYYNVSTNAGPTYTRKLTPNPYQDEPVGIAYLDKGFLLITQSDIVNTFFNWSAGTLNGTIPYKNDSSSGSTEFTGIYFTGATAAGAGCHGTAASNNSCGTASGDTYMEYYSFEKEWLLSVNCIAGVDEFYLTENRTASPNLLGGAGGGSVTLPNGQIVYNLTGGTQNSSLNSPAFITEVGIYDGGTPPRLLGVAKPDRPVDKQANQSKTFTLRFKF